MELFHILKISTDWRGEGENCTQIGSKISSSFVVLENGLILLRFVFKWYDPWG